MTGNIGLSAAAMANSKKRSVLIVQPKRGLLDLDLGEVWRYRELLAFLGWRDLSVLYKQTLIGVAWVVLQPLIAVVIFSIVFGNFARMPSDDLPYPIFVYAALLPWNLFAKTLTNSTASLVSSANLISKVYFPRLIIPLASAAVPVVDFLISSIILFGMMIWFKVPFMWTMLALPFFAFLAIIVALSAGLWLSALNVRYRDIGHAIPFMVQIWMYASPVVYSTSLVPERWRLLYGLNPMAGVIEGFRWALLGADVPNVVVLIVSIAATSLVLASGLVYFKRTEDVFADIV